MDNFFHHKISNEIYPLMYIMISFEMNFLLILLLFSLVFYDDFHFLIHFYDVYLMMIFHPIFKYYFFKIWIFFLLFSVDCLFEIILDLIEEDYKDLNSIYNSFLFFFLNWKYIIFIKKINEWRNFKSKVKFYLIYKNI